MNLRTLTAVFLVAVMPAPPAAQAQRATNAPSAATVVATVGDEPILARQVERPLEMITRGKKITPAMLSFVKAQVLEESIARRLVLFYAGRTGSAATDEEIQKARERLAAQRAAPGRSMAELARAESITEAELRRQLAWSVVWPKYVARYITPERMETYFHAHRRDLDGTELTVSHILLRPTAAGPDGKGTGTISAQPPSGRSAGNGASPQPAAGDEVLKQAEAIRREIVAGKLSFAEAARKSSTGPSRKEGGRLGPIGRQGPMDEAFSRAAFALQPGEVSPPVRTPFGVHLIRCDGVTPGGKRLADVHKEVEEGLERELLEKLARIERQYTPVKYTDAWPHFKPGTRELAAP